MSDTLRLNLAKITGTLALLATMAGGVWATAAAHSRLEAGERRAEQHEMWINQQTQRIKENEATVNAMLITLARIDENVQQLRREARRGNSLP